MTGLRARGTTALINTLCGPTTPFSCERAVTNGAWLALEFGVGDIAPADACAGVRGVYPHGPCMVLETYPGWFDQVGNPHQTMDATVFANWTESILAAHASISVYMAFGGTNFGFSNGADVYFNLSSPDILKYGPITTSYDYDAPLSEAGDPTPKYAALKAVFAKYVPVPPGPPPPPVPKGGYGAVPLPSCAPLAPLLAAQLAARGGRTAGIDLGAVAEALKERTRTLAEMADGSLFFFQDPTGYEPKAAAKNLTPDTAPFLAAARAALAALPAPWSAAAVDAALKALAGELGVGLGKVAQPLRVAVSGSGVSPPIDATLAILGAETVLRRVDHALAHAQGS